MDTLPLDLDGVIASLGGDDDRGLPTGTRLGHVHLQVADLAAAEAFYHDVLGFDVTVRGYPGALFLSAGGYHHHLGLNTWAGEGAPPPPPGSRGLSRFEVVLPDARELEGVMSRLARAGIRTEPDARGVGVSDPSGNRLLLAAPPRA